MDPISMALITLSILGRYQNRFSMDLPSRETSSESARRYQLPEGYPELLPDTESIRLLVVLPRSRNETVTCGLISVPLQEPPPRRRCYTALSYTWGYALYADGSCNDEDDQPLGSFAIFVNGERFPVRQNLYQALHSLPLEEEPWLLWVDAICINQKDREERSAQVKIMDKIYKGAEKVIAWLGREDTHLGDFDDLQRSFIDPLFLLGGPNRTYDSILRSSPYDEDFWRQLGHPKPSLRLRRSYNKFFERSWFSRVWVLQEFANGSGPNQFTFRCGRKTWNWSVFTFMVNILNSPAWHSFFNPPGSGTALLGTNPPERAITLLHTAQAFVYPNGFRRLFEHKLVLSHGSFEEASILLLALERTRHLNATDPLDKVYALLNLVSAACSQELPYQVVPDYTAVPSEVYRSITHRALCVLPVPGVLSMVYNQSLPRSDGLPSYVPDFGTTISVLSKPLGLEVGIERTCLWSPYKATGTPNTHINRFCVANTLHIKACFVDTITDIFFGLEEHSVISINYITSLMAFRDTFNAVYINGQGRHEALWRTLIADRHEGVFPAPATVASLFDTWMLQSQQGSVIESQYAPRLHSTILFQTRRGYIGLGLSRLAHVGDEVWLVENGRVPFVLRPLSGEDLIYNRPALSLVGECYVHGIMQGELMEGSGVTFEMVGIR